MPSKIAGIIISWQNLQRTSTFHTGRQYQQHILIKQQVSSEDLAGNSYKICWFINQWRLNLTYTKWTVSAYLWQENCWQQFIHKDDFWVMSSQIIIQMQVVWEVIWKLVCKKVWPSNRVETLYTEYVALKDTIKSNSAQ